MKKQIFAFIFVIGISTVIAVGQIYAHSELVRVDIPFAFKANNKAFPSGTYIVGPASNDRRTWQLKSVDKGPEIFLIAGTLSNANESDDVRLSFRRYGDQHFLIGFQSHSYQVKLPTSSSEKDFRRTLSSIAKNDVAVVEALSGRQSPSRD